MQITLIRASRAGHRLQSLHLPAGACVRDAVQACDLDLEGVAGYAVFGRRVQAEHWLADGDRLELLEALRVDPKQARRDRAGQRARR